MHKNPCCVYLFFHFVKVYKDKCSWCFCFLICVPVLCYRHFQSWCHLSVDGSFASSLFFRHSQPRVSYNVPYIKNVYRKFYLYHMELDVFYKTTKFKNQFPSYQSSSLQDVHEARISEGSVDIVASIVHAFGGSHLITTKTILTTWYSHPDRIVVWVTCSLPVPDTA